MQHAEPKGMTSHELDQLAINTIRTLSIDAVQQANSGHPGTRWRCAAGLHAWNEVMRFDPQDPIWPIAIALFCQTATLRCCCGRCCI